ncbi:MAG: SPFH domain-containing protein [Ignavibacteria bacterium]
MWELVSIPLALAALGIIYEYRLRKPDQLILIESEGVIKERKSRFYPRHLSLALPNTTHSTQLSVEMAVKGNLDIKVKLAFTVAASHKNIPSLVRVGGWNGKAVIKASKELETIIQSLIKKFVEKYEIEELSSEKIYDYLKANVTQSGEMLGLEIITLTIQSFDALDPKISEAMKQQESARIFEQTELLNQKARIAAAKVKLKADEEIAVMESELALKKYELKKAEMEKDSALAHARIEEELKRKKLQLSFDSDELELLKKSPELLMLTPQAARLAEASQTLKNARTIVSLSSNDGTQGNDLIGMFQKFLANAFSGYANNNNEKK